MATLPELFSQLCPNGVPFKRLDECCELQKGNTPIQKAIPGEYPLVVTTSERKSANTYQFTKPTVCIPLVSSRGHGVASINEIFYQEGKFALGNILCGVTPLAHSGLSAKFLQYYLNDRKDTLLVPLMKGGANVSLTVNTLKSVKVPVPPLPVQEEIVRILDSFTALTAELTAELTARKKQYKIYCQKTIEHFSDGNYCRIGDLGKWTGGMTPSMAEKAFWDDGNIPWVSSKDMKQSILNDTEDHITEQALKETSIKLLPKNTVAIVARSGILKHTLPIVYIPIPTTINQDIKALVTKEEVLAKYVYFALRGSHDELLAKTKKQGGTVDSLDIQRFMDFKISVPSIENQQKAVAILEQFDALCNDISNGLPAEMEARQKQYEYYRDKLLTFKELEQ